MGRLKSQGIKRFSDEKPEELVKGFFLRNVFTSTNVGFSKKKYCQINFSKILPIVIDVKIKQDLFGILVKS